MAFPTITLGGYELKFSATNSNDVYQMEFVPVVGRQANTLAGGLANLNLIYKKRWTITFRPGDDWENILALIEDGSEVSFVDKDGSVYLVKFVGGVTFNPYPYEVLGQMTVTIQEV